MDVSSRYLMNHTLETILTDTGGNRPAKINRADHGNGSGSSMGNTPMQAEQYQVNVTITKVGNNIIQSKIDSKYKQIKFK